jgi:hypothetical protein
MTHTTRLALSSSPTLRYVPPKVGFIRIRTTEGFSCAEDAGLFKPISNSQVICSVVNGWFVLLCAVRFGCASVLFGVICGSELLTGCIARTFEVNVSIAVILRCGCIYVDATNINHEFWIVPML